MSIWQRDTSGLENGRGASHRQLDWIAQLSPQKKSIGFAGARVGVGPGIKGDLDLEKIPESGELNNMLRRQNRAN